MSNPIAIIGAGIAGLACARRLQTAGGIVVLFDKGRSPGGRMATRRVETPTGTHQFDHGAQFFTARDAAFQAALTDLTKIAPSPIAPWPDDLATLANGKTTTATAEPRFIGTPGMSAVPKAMAHGLSLRLSSRVTGIERVGPTWTLTLESGQTEGPFSAVIVAVPAEQAGALLLPHAPDMALEAQTARAAPCWAGLFAFDQPTPTPFPALRLEDHPILAWIACDSAKPGRTANSVCWVAHARSDWTRTNLEKTEEEIAPLLQRALTDLFDTPSTPSFAKAHRWRYAQVEQAAPQPYAWNDQLQLGACGDWRIGPRVESAWLSGHHLAGAILA
ncbi:MAG: NAD(P)/FAD-dependent oxidoreductase [Caulobacterales bacterium]